jgi:hypothetical protein
LQDGVFVAVDLSSASRLSSSGGEALLAAPWSFTLSPGTYRARLETATYDGATSTPSQPARDAWSPANKYSAAWTSEEFTCASNTPTLSITPSGSATRGSSTSIHPSLASASSWTEDLRFVLVSGPSGMRIDSSTGEIEWTPGPTDIGQRAVVVALQSDATLLDIAGFEIAVSEP